jgi:hypothetical protein
LVALWRVTAGAQAGAVTIAEIQGTGARSPFAGQVVSTTGIVTARKSNGMFIQTADGATDGDPRTSEGLFVFTGSTPAATLTPGTLVGVTGRVIEFVPTADPLSPPLTEIGESPTIDVRGAGATLPSPVEITAAMLGPSATHDALERLEGMRVRVASLTLASPTLGSVTESTGSTTSNGVFYGVITSIARPFREPGVDVRVPLPPDSPCCVPRFDGNAERLRVDSDGQPGSAALNLASGTVLQGLVGALDYGFQSYTVLPDPATPPVIASLPSPPPPLRPAGPDEFTIASLNVARFFDTSDDPAVGDVVLTAAAFQARLAKLSLYVRSTLQVPDILGLQEVENLSTLQTIAATLNRDVRLLAGADPLYEAYLEEGNDPGGIDVGVLVKRARVEVLDYRQVGRYTPFIDPGTGRTELLNDRPPLLLTARVRGSTNRQLIFTVIVNHLRSMTDIDSATSGPRVRAKRAGQAEYLADLVQGRADADPGEALVAIGDLNAFEFSDGYADVVGTVRGRPAPANQTLVATRDRVEPDLVSMVETLPAGERYSYVFDGTSQALDHVLVNQNLLRHVAGFRYARGNADSPEVWRSDTQRPERASDHDAAVLYLSVVPR